MSGSGGFLDYLTSKSPPTSDAITPIVKLKVFTLTQYTRAFGLIYSASSLSV